MPKEVIKGYNGPYDVRVGWTQNTGVQVGVVLEDGRSLFWQLLGTNLAGLGATVRDVVETHNKTKDGDRELGEKILNWLDCVDGPVEEGRSGYSGVWADVDREAINRLIRILRRARDAAFGRDE